MNDSPVLALPKRIPAFLLKPILSTPLSNRITVAGSLFTLGLGATGLLIRLLGHFSGHVVEHNLTMVGSLSFIVLALALLFENQNPTLPRAKWELAGVGVIIGFLMTAEIVLGALSLWEASQGGNFFTQTKLWWGHLNTHILTGPVLGVLAIAAVSAPMLTRRQSGLGDFLGAGVLLLLTGYFLFLLSHLYGTPIFFGRFSSPPVLSVLGTVSLGLAILGRLGPAYFPARPLVGPSVRAVLLRKFLPVTIATLLIYFFVGRSFMVFMNPALSAFVTLVVSILVVILLVLRTSTAVSPLLQKALKEVERQYSDLVSGLKYHGMVLLNEQYQILTWNPGAERITGYSASEVVKKPLSQVLFDSGGVAMDSAFQKATEQGSFFVNGWAKRKDESPFWAEMIVNAQSDGFGHAMGFSVVIRDFTDRKKAEEKLRASLFEKDVMLKEIHHRVKNNLQVISSLLRLQSDKVKDEETLNLFRDSQDRVRSMAMVHEYLYQSPDLARIHFPDYVQSLVQNLCRSYDLRISGSLENQVRVEVDPVLISLDLAIPCGLVLTELVSNALKYAYSGRETGPITVRFRRESGGSYELTVADQGIGLPKAMDEPNGDSLGLRLVWLLTEQLRGTIRVERNGGTKFVITFRGHENNNHAMPTAKEETIHV